VIDHNFRIRHRQVNSDVPMAPSELMAIRHFDKNSTSHNLVVVGFKLFNALANDRFDGLGRLHIAESDLNWKFHMITLSSVNEFLRHCLQRTANHTPDRQCAYRMNCSIVEAGKPRVGRAVAGFHPSSGEVCPEELLYLQETPKNLCIGSGFMFA
jgi:hypothetical protein